MTLAAGLFVVGTLFDLTLVLALAWTCLLWEWMSIHVPRTENTSLSPKLFVLPLLSFPWINTDLSLLGWVFRLSGAAAVEGVFAVFDYDVVRNGTYLWIADKSISVEAACSGLNGLQAMLIAGVIVAYVKLKDSKLFWWNLPVLAGAAWVANTSRIILIVLLALQANLDAANDLVHGFAGWISLCLVFGICWILFWLQEPKDRTKWREPLRQPSI